MAMIRMLGMVLIVLSACGPRPTTKYPPVFLSGPTYQPTAGYDIHGAGGWLTATVGVPFDSGGLQANCYDGQREGAGWGSQSVSLNTGSLPPGLDLSSDGRITGVPTQAGDWNFTIHLAGVTCGGPFADLTVTVRIVTTGS